MDAAALSEISGDGGTQPDSAPEVAPSQEAAVSTEKGEISTAPPAGDEPDDFDPSDPAEQTPAQRVGLRRSLAEERRKWRKKEQELIAERERLRGQVDVFAQTRSPKQDEPESKPDDEFYRNPTHYLEQREKALTTQMEKRWVDMSVAGAKSRYQDYADAETAFIEAANQNRALWSQMRSEPDPAEFAYRYGKTILAVGEAGSLEEMEKRIEARTRERLEKEYREKYALDSAARATHSSAGARGIGANPAAVSSLEDIDFNAILKGINNQF